MNPVPVPARDGDHVGEVNEVRNRSQILSDISPHPSCPRSGRRGKTDQARRSPRLEWFLQAEYRACNKDWLEPKNLPALGKSD